MAFVNTSDIIGDLAAVNKLVEHSLTELKEDGIGVVAAYACNNNHGLVTLELPSVSRINSYAFANCTDLETVKLGGEGSSYPLVIDQYAFYNSENLKHLYIDRPSMAVLSDTTALENSCIDHGRGLIYVPENLLNAYKTDSIWKNYFITKLSDYPLSTFDSIEDSWSTILTNPDYASTYAVKDTKTLELTNGTKIQMDLAALNTDEKSDGSGTAKMTWICHGIPFNHRMNATGTTSGGWAGSEMRSWLISDILSKIPTEIKSHIVSVKKSYRSKSPNDETLWSNDEIWIPSYKEVGFTDASYIESDGVTYPILFPSGTGTSAKNARIKYNTSDSAGGWWIRSVFSTDSFQYVNSKGSTYVVGATKGYGVVFGFCTD